MNPWGGRYEQIEYLRSLRDQGNSIHTYDTPRTAEDERDEALAEDARWAAYELDCDMERDEGRRR